MTETGVSVIGPGQLASVNLGAVRTDGTSGVVWGVASPQLNTNLVKLSPGDNIETHTNGEVDVLVVVQSGTGSVEINQTAHEVSAGSAVLIPVGAERAILATTELVYLSVHTRRQGLQIGTANQR